jgi:uncharacterized protein (TIGR00251 family)
MSEPWYRLDEKRGCFTLTLHIQPNAAVTKVAGMHGDAVKVLVAAPAVENKANAKLVGYLSDVFAVPQSRVAVKQGSHGRRKIVEICTSGRRPEALLEGI